jgi:dTDP-4-amino-4,6-dideoxygalactose transaminase
VEGVNSRLDEVQAAILEIKFRRLHESLEKRFWIAAAYCQHLSRYCVVPRTTVGVSHSHHLFVVQVEERDRVCARLQAAGIEYGIHYPTPIHLTDAFRFLGYQAGSLPVTERAAQRILSLPCYPELPLDLVHEICGVVNDVIVDESEDPAHEGA